MQKKKSGVRKCLKIMSIKEKSILNFHFDYLTTSLTPTNYRYHWHPLANLAQGSNNWNWTIAWFRKSILLLRFLLQSICQHYHKSQKYVKYVKVCVEWIYHCNLLQYKLFLRLLMQSLNRCARRCVWIIMKLFSL